jgi:hypothetical protein
MLLAVSNSAIGGLPGKEKHLALLKKSEDLKI